MNSFGGIVMRDGSPVPAELAEALRSTMGGPAAAATTFADRGVTLFQFELGPVAEGPGTGHAPIVGSIRIDNREELRRRMQLRREASDEVLALEMINREGGAGAGDLIGAFAFAAWDPQRRTLTCARDHFGVRPFFYIDRPHLFAFASSLPPLLGILDDDRLDEVRIAQYLELHPADEDRTFYRGIKRLPRAHTLALDGHETRVEAYWTPDQLFIEILPGSESDVAEGLLEAFREAVRCRIDTPHPIGALLSGGLDSSSVVCMAGDLMPSGETLRTFSAVFPGLEQPYRDLADESRFIKVVTARPAIESALVEGDRLTPTDGLDRVVEIHGQPIDPPNAYLDLAMYRRAAETPARVILDGLEGDVTLSQGIHLFDELAASARWNEFFGESEAFRQRRSGDPQRIFGEYGLPHLSRASRSAVARQLPGICVHGGLRSLARATKHGLLRPRPAHRAAGSGNFLSSDRLRNAVHWADRVSEEMPPVHTEQEAHIRYLKGAYVPSLLEFSHSNAAAFGLEARHPMFDLRLVELAARIPANLKLRNGWNRYAFRLAMSGVVPPEILWRREKATLAPNFDLKMSNQEKEAVDLIIEETGANLAQFVDIDFLGRLVSQKAYRRIWPALVLALFLKKSSGERANRENAVVI